MNNLIRIIEDSQNNLTPRSKKELMVIGSPQVEQMIEKEDAALALV